MKFNVYTREEFIFFQEQKATNQLLSIRTTKKNIQIPSHTLEASVKGQKEPEQRLSEQRATKQRKKTL